ncbi:MFS transporter [Rhodococcus indonesiensis]|uniref:MFS transporter n=1 Tax=Rhodococcus indonesiensis TaxID=3055869 RepID=UPI0039F66496
MSHAPVHSEQSTAGEGPILPRTRLFGWAIGFLASNTFLVLPGLLLVIYLTNTLGVAAAVAGLVVALPKLWDTVLSFWVGAASDREAARTGGRQRMMRLGAVSLPVFFVLTFASPFTGNTGAVWVLVMFLFASTGYLLFQVPQMALTAEMTDSPLERTRIMTWRSLFFVVGLLIGGVLAPRLVGEGSMASYRTMAMTVGIGLLIALVVPVRSTRWVRSGSGSQVLGLRGSLAIARGNKAFFLLLTIYILMVIVQTMTLTGMPYVAAHYLGGQSKTAVLFFALTAASALSTPLLGHYTRRLGKPRMLTVMVWMWSITGAAFYPAVKSGLLATIVVAALIGVATMGMQISLFSMLPDTIAADTARTGRDQAGAFTGLWTAADNGSHAVGPLCYTLVLVAAGYVSSTHKIAQSSTTLEGILLGFSVIPACLLLILLPLIRRYARTDAGRLGARTR